MIKCVMVAIGIATLLTSCDKNEDIKKVEEILVFGHFYEFCGGEEWIEIFKLSENSLQEDTLDHYPSNSFYPGKYVPLSFDKYNQTRDLLDHFPVTLLTEQNTVIGIPDGGDWGGYYVEYKKGDVHRMWLLDKMKDNIPAKYHEFMDRMNDKIEALK